MYDDSPQWGNPATVWWEEIAGPRRMVREASAKLLSGRSLLLLTGDVFPWRWSFRGTMEDLLRNEGIDVEYIDCEETYACADSGAGEDLVEFLLQQIAPGALPDYYRDSSVTGSMKWLKSSGILNDRIIWFKGVPEAYQELFLRFISGYRSTSLQEGSFALELEALPEGAVPSKFVDTVVYMDYIAQADLRLFCVLMAQRSGIPDNLRDYIAAVVSNLCVTDGEVAEQMFQSGCLADEEPVTILKNCFQARELPVNRGAALVAEQPAHPFYLLRAGDENQLIRRVWKAQLQAAFPKIELERLQMVERYQQDLQAALDTPYWDKKKECARILEQYGAAIQDPYDVELGTFCFMLRAVRADDPSRYLLEIDPKDQERLFFLRNMRNRKLAHIYNNQNCTLAEMKDILRNES